MKKLWQARKSVAGRRGLSFLGLGLLLTLSACGGGGGDTASSNGNTSTGSVPTLLPTVVPIPVPTPTPAPAATLPSNCPHATIADMQVDKRLGCLSQGAVILDPAIYAVAGSAKIGTDSVEFSASQQIVLKNGSQTPSRWYGYMVCLKNISASSISPTFGVIKFSLDMKEALKYGDINLRSPDYLVSVTVFGVLEPSGSGLGYQAVSSCSTAKHPVIVDFATGKIESINYGALANVRIVEKK